MWGTGREVQNKVSDGGCGGLQLTGSVDGRGSRGRRGGIPFLDGRARKVGDCLYQPYPSESGIGPGENSTDHSVTKYGRSLERKFQKHKRLFGKKDTEKKKWGGSRMPPGGSL